MPAELRTERRGATLVLTLSAPATRNRLTEQLVAAGIEAMNVAESDPGVRCIVLCGDGAHFCAGCEPAAPAETSAARLQRAERLAQLAEAIRACPRPVVAAIEGCVGGAGLALALACDLRVVAEDAQFARPEDRPAPDVDGMAQALFAQALPRALALQWLWLDDPGFVRRWQACGGVQRICAAGQALGEACALADRLASLPEALLATGKELADRDTQPSFAQQLADARTRVASRPPHGR